MQITEAIKHMCEKSGKGVVGASQALGKSRMYLSALISRWSYPRTDTLVQIAQACGYKLVLEGNGEKIELDPEPFVNQVVVEYDPSSIERPGN